MKRIRQTLSLWSEFFAKLPAGKTRQSLSLWSDFLAKLPAENADSIRGIGHRGWVGGNWDEIGRLQFDFLRSQGVQPHNVLLDIACGSLRAGRLLIPYLDVGHYLGIEKHQALVDDGLREEIAADIVEFKRPEFVISSRFEFSRFSRKPDICIAQSLFTHLSPVDINLCLNNLARFANSKCRVFATFFEVEKPHFNFGRRSHSYAVFFYTRKQMVSFGERNGWSAHYIGDWDHPRGQRMMEYRLC